MQRSADRVAIETGKVERLGNRALPDERRIAVQQHRHHPRPLHIHTQSLLAASTTHHHAVHRLEVARVAGHRQVDGLAIAQRAITGVASVILDIAAASSGFIRPGVFKLREDLLVALAQDIVQDIEAAAVGHAQHHLFNTQFARGVDRAVQKRDKRLAAFEAESLVAGVPLLQELLKLLRSHNPFQDVRLVSPAQRDPAAVALEALQEPGPLVGVAHVGGLERDAGAIRVFKKGHDLPQRGRRGERQRAEIDRAIQIAIGKSVVLQCQRLWTLRSATKGIELRSQVPDRSICLDQVGSRGLKPHRLGIGAAAALWGGRASRTGKGEIKALEKRPKIGLNRGRSGEVSRIFSVKILGAPTVHRRWYGARCIAHKDPRRGKSFLDQTKKRPEPPCPGCNRTSRDPNCSP